MNKTKPSILLLPARVMRPSRHQSTMVSDYCTRHSKVPVLVIKSEQEEAAEEENSRSCCSRE